jgi:phosphatidylethanolamine/phosphatidyl-N-methylethanolamine N-methyltransferase
MKPSTPARPANEHFRFLSRMIANPRAVGSILPSGSALARAMVAQADFSKPGPVLELGPGSGGITRELVRVLPRGRLTVVERDPHFADLLTDQFPGLDIIRGDAFDLRRALGGRFDQPFAAIVSCIPLLNFPTERRQALLESCFDLMAPNAPIIQFTYGLGKPAAPPPGVTATRAAFVLRNIPPAIVWVFRRPQGATAPLELKEAA